MTPVHQVVATSGYYYYWVTKKIFFFLFLFLYLFLQVLFGGRGDVWLGGQPGNTGEGGSEWVTRLTWKNSICQAKR